MTTFAAIKDNHFLFMKTKINFFLIVTTLLLISFSCENQENYYHPIPNIRVNFTLDIITTPELQTSFSPKYIGAANGQKAGYKGHGVYVIKINSKEFRAFDASCPYQNNEISHPEIEEHLLQKDKSQIVYCTKCKSEFNLQDGNLLSGPANFPLKEYKAILYNSKIRVSNANY